MGIEGYASSEYWRAIEFYGMNTKYTDIIMYQARLIAKFLLGEKDYIGFSRHYNGMFTKIRIIIYLIRYLKNILNNKDLVTIIYCFFT